MDEREPEPWGPSGDPGHSPVSDLWRPPTMPEDSRRMGLDRNTVEGAWLEFASVLDRRKPSHVVVAVLALAIFVIPVLLTLLDVLRRMVGPG
ncbi:hypothetical protein ACFP3Q_10865 [Nocardioides sp. GCM10027113]|uniref:hypothetical protein n=1 Tax=unclassified Nocardioides TaxID=2615069 RepID=UPI00360A38DC